VSTTSSRPTGTAAGEGARQRAGGWGSALAGAIVLALAFILAAAAPASAQEVNELIRNGAFDDGTTGWWATGNLSMEIVDGRLCVDVPGGTTNPWDAIVGQDGIALAAGESYAFAFDASASAPAAMRGIVQLPVDPFTAFISLTPTLGADPQTVDGTFTAPQSLDDAQVVFQVGGSPDPWTFCLDNVTLTGGAAPPTYEPDTGPRVRVNQVGYLPDGPKGATLVTEATEALPWELHDESGAVVADGMTTPWGIDLSSAQNVHTVDFGEVTAGGSSFTLVADGERSHPFDIAPDAYTRLRVDALNFYYTQRSGSAIDGGTAGAEYARPAGHAGVPPNRGDTAVPCQPADVSLPIYGEPWTCDYTLDVTGGWYDAGDHGKYVVNGGISVAQLMSTFERTKTAATAHPDALDDGTLAVPERGNGVPDVLDEARWELEFLLRMQVPEGEPLAGMAHHKIHDDEWTGLPLLPHLDDKVRELHRPSTAATLNLAAAAAQGARLFASYDRAFSDRLLAAARRAWSAARDNPALYAPPEDGASGGGPYDDTDVSDEFYWAAAELYLTTGERRFADAVTSSPQHTAEVFTPGGFSWRDVAALGRLDLATVPNALPDRDRVRASVVAAADAYLATQTGQAYGHPYAPQDGEYVWGSNSQILNNMVVLGTAFDLTGDRPYRDAVIRGMDYLLGRNALNQSYITGYGEHDARNQHSRWYARQLNPSLPNPPDGAVAGGPNSLKGTWDPVAQRLLTGCAPQFCYIDDIESWSTNEITINWNSALSWVASFVADQGTAAGTPELSCTVEYRTLISTRKAFAARVRVTNTGSEPVRGWELRWAYTGGQSVKGALGARVSQRGATVITTNPRAHATLRPGKRYTFGILGVPGTLTTAEPELFRLNGSPCTTR
jgi:endoglucanase